DRQRSVSTHACARSACTIFVRLHDERALRLITRMRIGDVSKAERRAEAAVRTCRVRGTAVAHWTVSGKAALDRAQQRARRQRCLSESTCASVQVGSVFFFDRNKGNRRLLIYEERSTGELGS